MLNIKVVDMLKENFRLNLIHLLDKQGRGARSGLARHLDVSLPFISQLCDGSCVPTLDRIEQIAAYFKIKGHRMLAEPKVKIGIG